MAKTNDNKRLYKGNGITIGEISTVLNNNSKDLGTLCKSSTITPWALYKPFRDSALYYDSPSDWEDAMEAAGYGFGDLSSTTFSMRYFFNAASPFQSPEWESNYLKPRGKANNEYFRQLDFVDMTNNSEYGYDSTAKPPMEITFPDKIYQGGGQITVKVNSSVSGWQTLISPYTWISIDKLFGCLDAGKTYNLGVLFRTSSFPNLTDGNLLIIDSDIEDFENNSQINIPFTGDPATAASSCLIPLFDKTNNQNPRAIDGDTVYATVVLVENQVPSLTSGYKILTGNDIASVGLISLNFKDDMDKAAKTFVKEGNLTGTEVEVNDFTLSSAATLSGGYKAFYMQNIKLKVNSVGPYAYSGESVYCKLFIKVNRNNWVMATDQYDGQSTSYSPASGSYYPSDNPGIMNGDGNYEVTFNIPASAPGSAWEALVGYGSGSGHIMFPYIYAPGSAGDTFSVEISGYIYNGSDIAASRVNITSKTKTITF